jgi:hypothetical protein
MLMRKPMLAEVEAAWSAGPCRAASGMLGRMQLHYLDFDFSDEDTGRGSFDAMASVAPERLPALLAEVAAVLGWAFARFAPGDASGDDGGWDYELRCIGEPDTPLGVVYDERRREVVLTPAGGAARITLTLTLAGSPEFCGAFREWFETGD